MPLLILFLTVSVFNFSAYSQLIGTYGYGGNSTFEIASVIKNDQEEVFLVGSAFNESDEDILVVKHSQAGELLWSKFFGVNGNVETARSAVTDGEGGVYVIGQSRSTSSTEDWSGAYLIRITQDGEVVFSNRYTATTTGSVSETGITMTRIDSMLYLGGLAYEGSNEDVSDYFITQTDLGGNTNWSRSYGTSGLEGISTLSKGIGESLISTGQMTSASPSVDFAAGIGRYDLNGDPIWLRSLEFGVNFSPKTIMSVADGYVVFGVTAAETSGMRNFILVKVDESGETVWSKEILLDGDETPIDMKLIDGNIVVSGYTDGFADQDNHIVVLSFDQLGNMLWDRGINESVDDFVYSDRENLIIESTNEFVQVGYTAAVGDGSGNSEIRVSHVGPDQLNSCGEFEPGFEVVDISVSNSAIELDPAFNFTNFVVGSYSQDTDLNSSLCISEVNIILPDTITYCYNSQDTIETINVEFDNYLWSTNETTSEIIPDEGGWFWVDAEVNELSYSDSVFVSITTPTIDLGPDQMICDDEEYLIEPEGNYTSLTWMSGGGFDQYISEAGTYWVEAQIDSCSVMDTIDIEVVQEPDVNIEDNLLICSPEDSILIDTELDNSYNFTWSNGDDGSQSYLSVAGLHWLEVEIENCPFEYEFETSMATQNLIEETQLSICDGASVEIQMIDPGMEGSWNIGESGNSIEVENTGTYVVELLEQDCLLSDSVEVVTITPPDYQLDDQQVCPGSTFPVTTPSFAQQVWVNGNETTESEVSLYSGNHQVEYLFEGCTFSSSFEINTIEDTLELDTHHFICEGDSLTLSLDTIYNPVWEGFVESSTFIVTQEGLYEVAFDMFDCTFGRNIEVELDETCPCPEPVFVPNAFTPNADGNNEFFRPVIYCPLSSYHLTIFDRWGQVVFDSKDPEKVWDGSNNGGDYFVQNDTYQFVLEFSKMSSSATEVVRGHVTVIR